MNNHIYSLEYILLTLRLVIKHLDFNEEDIFRYGSDKDQPPLQALKDYISLILNKQKSEDSLPQFILDFNNAPENIEKKLEITHNTLSKFSQEVMIHGCLLDKSSLKVLAAWTLLCNELYIPWTLLDNSTALSNIAQTKSKTFSSFTEKNNFLRIFNDFLNALCALGYQQTVEAFHQFLYITHQVTHHNEKNQTTPEGIAKIQSICFTNGLELEGVLSKIDPLEDNLHYTALLKQENMLFFEMVKYLANCDQFKKPFSIADYKPNLSSQFNATFEEILASIWAKPNIAFIPYSNDMFGATSKSNLDPSLLPVIPDNSETAADDLRTRSQSPRTHITTKAERNKKSFDRFRKKAASSEPSLHKTNEEKRDNEKKTELAKGKNHLTRSTPIPEKKPTSPRETTIAPDTKLRKKSDPTQIRSIFPDSSPIIEAKFDSKKNAKPENPVIPLLKFPTAAENSPQQKSPVLRSPSKPKPLVSTIFTHNPQNPTSSFYSSPEKSDIDIDKLAEALHDLKFGDQAPDQLSSETEENGIHHKRKSSKEKKGQSHVHSSEYQPLLPQYTSGSQKRHNSKSKPNASYSTYVQSPSPK